MSRLNNSISNIKSGIVYKCVNLILKFLLRTVFIYSLGQSYVGINGVFSNILSVLSLTELGVGTAIIYDTYKPIAEGNKIEITQIFKYYRKVYYIIGIIIFVAGMLICPFLKYIVNGVDDVPYITVIYILTVISTVSSYFFAQYSSIIEANQKQSIVSNYNIIGSFIKTVLEVLVLVCFKSYIVYLVIEILVGVFINILIASKALKLYPYLSDKVNPIRSEKVRKIWKNAFSAFSIKTASTVVNSTDNILISSLITTLVAGSYSTYLLIVMSVQQIVYTLKTGIMASVGNLCVSGSYADKQKIFKNAMFVFSFINGIICACFMVGLTPFIKLWAGDSYVLQNSVVIVIVINYYLRGMQWPIEVFYNADGLYRHFKFKPWLEVTLNIIISYLLAKKIGILGIIIGTTISELMTTTWYDIYVTNKYSLKGSLKQYWIRNMKYICTVIILNSVAMYLANIIMLDNIYIELVIKCLVAGGVVGIGYIMIWFRSDEFKYYYNTVLNKIKSSRKIIES